MIETTAYFEAYRYVLEGLQEQNEDKLPFQRCVFGGVPHITVKVTVFILSHSTFITSSNGDFSKSSGGRNGTKQVLLSRFWLAWVNYIATVFTNSYHAWMSSEVGLLSPSALHRYNKVIYYVRHFVAHLSPRPEYLKQLKTVFPSEVHSGRYQ